MIRASVQISQTCTWVSRLLLVAVYCFVPVLPASSGLFFCVPPANSLNSLSCLCIMGQIHTIVSQYTRFHLPCQLMGISMPGRMNPLLYDVLAGYVTVPGAVHASKRQVCCQLYEPYIGGNAGDLSNYNSLNLVMQIISLFILYLTFTTTSWHSQGRVLASHCPNNTI